MNRFFPRLLLPVLAALLLAGCASRMFYHPDGVVYGSPAENELAFEDVAFQSADGTTLSGWFVPAVGGAKGTVVHFHGNAQNMTAHFSYVDWLPREGFHVFVFDYRGYGRSEGEPGRRGVHEDSCAALDYVRTRADVDPSRLLVLGQSLGGANALAALEARGTEGVRAVAVDSAFSSYRRIVRDKIGALPLLGLARWPLSFLVVADGGSPERTVRAMQGTPLLVLHGTRDAVVPFRHGERLFAAALEPKRFVPIPGGRHADALSEGRADVRRLLVEFFEAGLAAPVGAARRENSNSNDNGNSNSNDNGAVLGAARPQTPRPGAPGGAERRAEGVALGGGARRKAWGNETSRPRSASAGGTGAVGAARRENGNGFGFPKRER